MDELLLIERIKAGDRQAFNVLIEMYQSKVIHFAYSMLSDYEDACDASQEAFIKIYKSLGAFRGDSKFSTWVYRITKNVCTDYLRKKKGKIVSIDEEKDDEPKLEIIDTSKNPENISIQNETTKIVRDALKQLDESSRTIITMFDIEGASYDEISKIMDIPMGTVKSRLNRARDKLRKILSEKREHFL